MFILPAGRLPCFAHDRLCARRGPCAQGAADQGAGHRPILAHAPGEKHDWGCYDTGRCVGNRAVALAGQLARSWRMHQVRGASKLLASSAPQLAAAHCSCPASSRNDAAASGCVEDLPLEDLPLTSTRCAQVSDGQRRRVQICVGLLRPFKVRLAAESGAACALLECLQLLLALLQPCGQTAHTRDGKQRQ